MDKLPGKTHRRTDRTENFGRRLRQLRRDSGLTLQQVADRAGLAISTISKAENNQLSPTYENIVRLAEGLSVDVAELFNLHPQPMTSGRMALTRAGGGVQHHTPQYIYEVLCSEISHKRFIPLTAIVKANSIHDFPAMPLHAGEEFVYVITGKIVIHTDNYEPITMEAGDSCYFDSRMGHAIVSAGDEDAKVIWICSHIHPPADFPKLDA